MFLNGELFIRFILYIKGTVKTYYFSLHKDEIFWTTFKIVFLTVYPIHQLEASKR